MGTISAIEEVFFYLQRLIQALVDIFEFALGRLGLQ